MARWRPSTPAGGKRETDTDELDVVLGGRMVNLELYRRWQQLSDDDLEYADAERRLPARYQPTARYPLLVVHDGGDYLEYSAMKTVLEPDPSARHGRDRGGL